jgi:cellulose synthase (UDP-forming)
LREIGPIRDLLMRIDVDRSHEAVPVMPLSTISVTEDLSTAMRIHSLGYSSVYHPKVLAHGLAPEDLRSAMQQRLRWAQGTIQVMLRENPLTYPGLAPVQRLMYFATMWSYLFGFFAVVYLAAPVLYLLFGWTPVEAYTGEFLRRLIPYLVANQILFLVVSWRLKTWRGQQYNLALFPVWIHAVVSTVRSVFLGRRLDFVVTPKGQRQRSSVADISWQLVAIGALTVAVAVGLAKLAVGDVDDRVPITINILWALYDLLALSVVIWALARRSAAAPAATAAPVRGGADWPAPRVSGEPVRFAPRSAIDGTIEPWDGGVAVIRLRGRLDFAASGLARRRFHDLVRGGYRRLVIDLHGVDTIDSAGIVSLIEGLKAARQVGGDLRIADAAAATKPALAMADLDRVLRLYPTVEDAVAAYFR